MGQKGYRIPASYVDGFSQIWLCRKCGRTIISSGSSGQTGEIASVNQPDHSEARLNRSWTERWWNPTGKELRCVLMRQGLAVRLNFLLHPGLKNAANFKCVCGRSGKNSAYVCVCVCLMSFAWLLISCRWHGWPYWGLDECLSGSGTHSVTNLPF